MAELTARFALRAATALAHERLDQLYSQFDLGRIDDYRRFLRAHASAYLPVEAALEAAGAAALVPGWLERCRSNALRQDLGELGMALPTAFSAPPFLTPAATLGGLYVLEGSRLGGALLVRAVEPDLPTAFLSPGNPTDWRAFIAILDEQLSSQALVAEAASSALSVFSLFEQAAQVRDGAERP